MEDSLLELQDIISTNCYENGINTYNIVETRTNGDIFRYSVNGLGLEVENGIVLFIDDEDQFFYRKDITGQFLVESVCSIELNKEYFILLKHGVKIEIIPL